MSLTDTTPSFTAPLRYWNALQSQELLDLDVHLQGGGRPRETMRAHSLVLSTSCPHLHDVVIDAERKSARPEITLPHLTKEEFEPVLRFIYTELADGFTDVSLMCAGLKAAEIFKMENLANSCRALLRERFKEDELNTALRVFENSEKLGPEETELMDAARLCFSRDMREVLKSDAIVDVSYDTMEEILDMPVREAVDEMEYFRAVHRWAIGRTKKNVEGNESELRDVCGGLLQKIR